MTFIYTYLAIGLWVSVVAVVALLKLGFYTDLKKRYSYQTGRHSNVVPIGVILLFASVCTFLWPYFFIRYIFVE